MTQFTSTFPLSAQMVRLGLVAVALLVFLAVPQMMVERADGTANQGSVLLPASFAANDVTRRLDMAWRIERTRAEEQLLTASAGTPSPFTVASN